jgi:quercetin dioxygenase-like cupin family protein
VAATISGRIDFPFMSEYTLGGEVREFKLDREDEEYVWHRDREEREIEVLEGEGWQFQYENCLPYLLEPGMIFDIPEGEYHRLIKGYSTLKVRIIAKDGK